MREIVIYAYNDTDSTGYKQRLAELNEQEWQRLLHCIEVDEEWLASGKAKSTESYQLLKQLGEKLKGAI